MNVLQTKDEPHRPRALRTTVVVDAHAHFYPAFNARRFIESAVFNMRLDQGGAIGVLCVAAAGEEHPLRDIRAAISSSRSSWQVDPTLESTSLVLCNWDRRFVVLLASRQLTTLEGLEVLALGTDQCLADGSSLTETIESIHDCHAIPVIPWGLGKWWFRRGRTLIGLLSQARSTFDAPLFLGDVAGRCRWLPFDVPAELRYSFQTLYGSDPLPLRNAELGVARMASRWDCALDLNRPCESLLHSLRRMISRPRAVGRRDMPLTTLSNQLRLRSHLL